MNSMESFKVRFDGGRGAYLDTKLPDGTFTGVDKHTDEPVHLAWLEEAQEWVSVK